MSSAAASAPHSLPNWPQGGVILSCSSLDRSCLIEMKSEDKWSEVMCSAVMLSCSWRIKKNWDYPATAKNLWMCVCAWWWGFDFIFRNLSICVNCVEKIQGLNIDFHVGARAAISLLITLLIIALICQLVVGSLKCQMMVKKLISVSQNTRWCPQVFCLKDIQFTVIEEFWNNEKCFFLI